MEERKQEKIKVCFVSPFAYQLFNPRVDLKFGGAEVQMYFIATELAQDDGFDVNFVVLDVGQLKKESYNSVRVWRSYKRGRNIFNLILAPIKLIFTLARINPDVVVSRAVGVEVGFSCLYAKLFRKRFIYSIAHDRDVDKSFFKGFRGRIFQFGFEKADIYVAQSRKQVNILEQSYGKRVKNIKVIPNSFRLENKKTQVKNFVLWVGSSIDFKRGEIFLDLARHFPGERFVMVMTKNKAAMERWHYIKKQAEELDNLQVLDQVPFSRIGDYFAQAKVFVNTSTAEGFPNTFLQAMMNKTPILSMNVNPDDFIHKHRCGLVSNDNFRDLKDNLRKLLQDEKYYRQIQRNVKAYMRYHHDLKDKIEEWKDLLKN